MNTGILNLEGANCPSCVYTIEHLGRKIDGVEDVMVDVNAKEIRVDYQGDRKVLDDVSRIVSKLGYSAEVRAAETRDDA